MSAYAATLLVLAIGDAAGAEASPAPTPPAPSLPLAPPAPPAPPAPTAPLGSALDLPRPSVLPCRRFETVEIHVGSDVDHLSHDPGAVFAWRAAGRDWSFAADFWRQPPGPLTAAALPRRVLLSTSRPISAALLTFYCRRYEMTEAGMGAHDNDPFMGVEWLCTSGGCVANAGYPLPKQLATSRRRLRLCAKDPQRNWDEDWVGFRPCHDVAPALGDREKALVLLGKILADARRTLADACRVPDTCTPGVRAATASLLPARWRPTSWSGQPYSGQPARMKLGAETEGRKVDVDCGGERDGEAYCKLTLLHGDGRPILRYMPIHTSSSPAEAMLTLTDRGDVWPHFEVLLTAASGDPHDDAHAACSVSGALLATH